MSTIGSGISAHWLRHAARGAVAATLSLALGAGCFSQTKRFGPPIRLPAGEPRNACESARWLELWQVRGAGVESDSISLGGGMTSSWSTRVEADGFAVYPHGSNEFSDPMPVEEVLTRVHEPELLEQHMAPVRRVRVRHRNARFVVAGGAVTTVGGAALFFASSSGDVPVAVPITVAGLGLVGMLVGYILIPAQADRAWANLHDEAFVPPADDMSIVNRGIERFHQSVRASCADAPTP